MRSGLVIVVGFGLMACSLITAPLPRDAKPFAPPSVYNRWWAMTEACSGLSGDMRDVDWYRVRGRQFLHGERVAAGSWNRFPNRIVLAESIVAHGQMVRHEMLHALRRVPGHPRSQFLGRCAGLVLCQGSCIESAGHWRLPRRDYVVLPPESLDVSSRATVMLPEADGQRWFELEVIVRNPRGRAVLVAAPRPESPPTFGYDLRGPSGGISGGISGGDVVTDSSTLFFEPFETKRRLFEFQIKPEPFDARTSGLSPFHLSPGTYLVRGDYARHRPAYDTIAVSP